MRNWVTQLCILGLTLTSQASWAGFGVDDKPPEDGLAHTVKYNRAMKGQAAVDLRADDDMDYQLRMIPEHRYYLSFSYGSKGVTKFKSFQNRTQNSTATVSSPSLSQKKNATSLEWGYLWEKWSLGTRLLLGPQVTYSANPVLSTGTNFRYTAQVKTQAGLLDLEYDFIDFWHLRPFIGVGAGLIYRSIDITLSEGETGTRSYPKVGIAGEYYGGIKAQLFPNVGLSVARRHTNLGPLSLHTAQPTTDASRVRIKVKEATLDGWFLSLIYRF